MSTILDENEILEEICVKLRNSDIFTISQRGVTTTTASGTFSTTSSLLIAKTNVRNIRSIVVGSTTLVFGTDYVVDYTYLSTTYQCLITFTVAQTGAYVVTYDYGTDKIFPDFPKEKLSIDSFPRIGVYMIGQDTSDASLDGNNKTTNLSLSIAVFAEKNKEINNYIKLIETAIIGYHKSFFYIRYITKIRKSGLTNFNLGNDKIKFRTIDYMCPNNDEVA